jgi:hypothetical protein
MPVTDKPDTKAAASPPEGGAAPEAVSPWRRLKITGIVIASIVVVFITSVWIVTRSGNVSVLLANLRDASEAEREELMMRLSLARGDVVPQTIEAFGDTSAPAHYRAALLGLLFKINSRFEDKKIQEVLKKALKDPSAEVSRKAVHDYTLYMDHDKQIDLLDLVRSPDPEIRKQVGQQLCARERGRRRRSLWGPLSREDMAERKEKLIADAIEQAKLETDPELKGIMRSIVGRRIEELCGKASEAVQRSDPVKAEELLEQARKLDPGNQQAMIATVRHHLKMDDREKALELARKFGALLRVPKLSSAPLINGDPTDKVWQEAFADGLRYRSSSRWTSMRVEGRSEMRIGHRDGTIYISVLAYEDDLSELVVKHKTRDSDVWRDDCAEFMFDPTVTARPAYQIIVNAAGIKFDSHQHRRDVNFEFDSAVSIFEGRGYWACELAVAASEFGDAGITADSVWGMNIVRTRIAAAEQHIWWPTYGRSIRYHLHPLAVFEGAPAAPADKEGNE